MCGGTGPASRWLHDELSPGQEIELIGIGGDFFLDVLGAAGDPTGPAEEAEVGIPSLAPKKKKTKKLLLLSAGIERDYPPFFEFSLCLSRACLGKMFVFI
jgi:hypothetical protein